MLEKREVWRPRAVSLAIAVALVLSACGGGGSNTRPSPPPAPPASGSGGAGDDVYRVGAGTVLKVASGQSIAKRISLGRESVLDNAGVLGGDIDTAVEAPTAYDGAYATVLNHDGGSIKAKNVAVLLQGDAGTVNNSNGAIIEGGQIGVGLGYGGTVSNDGAGSIIRSTSGMAVQVLGESGTVKNSGTGLISARSTAIYLEHGGTIDNGAGSVIETSGAAGTGCLSGACAIFVASDSNTVQNLGGALRLTNAGLIVGNVEMVPTAANTVELAPGGSIHGNLDIGSRADSILTLGGDAGTLQAYSQAVTGATTFAGFLNKRGDGTWIIDSSLTPGSTVISSGTLQVGNGGTAGDIGQGNVTIYHGSLVFDRSDDLIYQGAISSENSTAYDGTLVQAGTGVLTLTSTQIMPSSIEVRGGTLQIGNTGQLPGSDTSSFPLLANVANDGSLVFDSNYNIFFSGAVSGKGSVTQDGSAALIMQAKGTYTGGTAVNNGALWSGYSLPGNVTVGAAGELKGFDGGSPPPGFPGATGDLANAGKVYVRKGDSQVGGNYTQAASGSLAVTLGSKLDVAGTATLDGGTLEITGAESGYVSNTHTAVLNAAGGVAGTFDHLVKDTGVVFTATTINYDANSVWLDTTGLNVTTAAAGQGVSYTPVSMASAQRVQGAFQQLDHRIAAADLSGVSADFLRAAGQFQQSPTLQAAQASLRSLSGQLHAASAAMTFNAIDASSRALVDRFDSLLDKEAGFGMWTHNLSVGGGMTRAGYDGVGYQLDGWLVGSDRQVGQSGVAGFAFGQNQGQQRLDRGFDHDNSRSTEGMLYAGWLKGNWYTQGRAGFGRFQQDVRRQILLGNSVQGVATGYNGRYGVAYGESGLRFDLGGSRLTPFVDVQYARIGRDGFAEQGAGGFGLRSNAQMLDRWQMGLGVRAGHRWDLGGSRRVDLSAHAQWQRNLATHGDVFDASFVGLPQWQPLAGIGVSRYSGLFGVGLDAMLSARAALKFGYDYQKGQRDHAQTLSAGLNVAF